MAEYINKQELIDELNKTYDRMAGARPEYYSGYQLAVGIVRNCKVVDVTPVRHGRWIDCEDDYGSYVRCSVCGDEYTNWEADLARSKFCPNCGAKMDGIEPQGEDV